MKIEDNDKVELFSLLTDAINSRFTRVAEVAVEQPFAVQGGWPVRVVPMTVVGEQLQEQLLEDIKDIINQVE